MVPPPVLLCWHQSLRFRLGQTIASMVIHHLEEQSIGTVSDVEEREARGSYRLLRRPA